MDEKTRELGAKMLRQMAERVEKGDVNWFWMAVKMPNGRITYATKGAPDRPAGLGSH